MEPRLLLCTAGSLTGILISPDLDLDAKNISSTIIKKKAGNFAVALWDMFWNPYRRSFKHGSFGSHFPGYSTFVRLTYVYFMTILPFYLIYSLIFPTGYFKVELMLEYYYWVKIFLNVFFFYGLASSDLVHFFLDILTKESVK